MNPGEALGEPPAASHMHGDHEPAPCDLLPLPIRWGEGRGEGHCDIGGLTVHGEQPGQWTASTDTPRRSVFKNYNGRTQSDTAQIPSAESAVPQAFPSPVVPNTRTLQTVIDTAIARAFLYQFLARAFDDSAGKTWQWLTDAATRAAFTHAVHTLENPSPNLERAGTALVAALQPHGFESFQTACVTAFGHAARGDCPLNEIEYGDLNADPLFQPHRLADVAAFYRAFGMEVADSATERPDHIGMELEFMSLLAAREAYALEHQWDDADIALGHDAQKQFLREHLGRWSPAFARRLARAATDSTLVALAEFTGDFVTAESARFGLPPGNEDLLLRPVDTAEQLCSSCGLQTLPPGAGPLQHAT
jgi:DMSO reductase family type II enzyme chaperone